MLICIRDGRGASTQYTRTVDGPRNGLNRRASRTVSPAIICSREAAVRTCAQHYRLFVRCSAQSKEGAFFFILYSATFAFLFIAFFRYTIILLSILDPDLINTSFTGITRAQCAYWRIYKASNQYHASQKSLLRVCELFFALFQIKRGSIQIRNFFPGTINEHDSHQI